MKIFDVKQFRVRVRACIENLVRKILWVRRISTNIDGYEPRVDDETNRAIDTLVKIFQRDCGLEFSNLLMEEVDNFAWDIFAEGKADYVTAYARQMNYVIRKITDFATRQIRKTANDIFKEFIENNLEFQKATFVTKDDVYNAYLRFAIERKSRKIFSKVTFGKLLKSTMPKIETARKMIHGKRVYGWRNLRLLKTS